MKALIGRRVLKLIHFPLLWAKTGRGVAELLMDPVSQIWRAKPNQKEFLNKIDEVENFKKNDDGKRNEDFRFKNSVMVMDQTSVE